MTLAIRVDTKSPRRLVELTTLRTAQRYQGHYEINQHRSMMRVCDYIPQQIEAVGNWRTNTMFNDWQRALLGYVDQTSRVDVDDATIAAFEKFFDVQGIVELAITMDTFVGAVLFTGAMRVKIGKDERPTPIGKC